MLILMSAPAYGARLTAKQDRRLAETRKRRHRLLVYS